MEEGGRPVSATKGKTPAQHNRTTALRIFNYMINRLEIWRGEGRREGKKKKEKKGIFPHFGAK